MDSRSVPAASHVDVEGYVSVQSIRTGAVSWIGRRVEIRETDKIDIELDARHNRYARPRSDSAASANHAGRTPDRRRRRGVSSAAIRTPKNKPPANAPEIAPYISA